MQCKHDFSLPPLIMLCSLRKQCLPLLLTLHFIPGNYNSHVTFVEIVIQRKYDWGMHELSIVDSLYLFNITLHFLANYNVK